MTRDDDFRSVLVVCTRQIGDVLLTTPLIAAAQARWPQARIDVLGFAGTLGMLRGNRCIGELIEVPPGSGWWASLGLIRRLWRRYDLALITQRSDRAFWYGLVAARRRAGLLMGPRRFDWWKRPFLAHGVVITDAHAHAVTEKLALLQPWLGAKAEAAALHVEPPAARELPAALGSRLRARYLVVHAPSMWRYKQWPVEHFRVLVGALLADGHQVVLSGSGGANDQAVVAALRDLAPTPALLDASGQLDLDQLGTLLRGAALYVGPDTSITHLAVACGTPTIALYGPTPPTVWGPWPQGHPAGKPWQPVALLQRRGSLTLMQGPAPCVPCGRAGCEDHPGSRADCLQALDPQRVLAEARERLRAAR
ncbi:MAG TPA: glycosyltransferase family 9 protein [Methylibium sp.]|uniref:glycosyltransferase family 9 protein n=1 Tax=Methylibium sp. TaxID=2067992 RepID=UPI002DBC6690|nr:glycosyltransferase family 9 protein [Methylibium sp.]HEU4458436.1 glycosyltransferase family 9 protein [Methylibium sp.]